MLIALVVAAIWTCLTVLAVALCFAARLGDMRQRAVVSEARGEPLGLAASSCTARRIAPRDHHGPAPAGPLPNPAPAVARGAAVGSH
jgi:hypothetical protein